MTAVHHIHDWSKGGVTDIGVLTLGCDGCHALIHDGPGGWHTRAAPKDSEHAGRTEWIPPPHLDPDRKHRVNHRHHPKELLDRARRKANAHKNADALTRREQQQRPTGSDEADEIP